MSEDLPIWSDHPFELLGQHLRVDLHRVLYWQESATLIVSDLHLGKAAHFRKNGIPIPRQIHVSDFQRLNAVIAKYTPDRIVFLGDLFHSEANEEWSDFIHWSNYHQNIEQVLVRGNHDVLSTTHYGRTKMNLVDFLEEGPFYFSHDETETELYNISGHVHPCIRLHGPARQGLRLSCFYFSQAKALLPAFGAFTGNYPIISKKGDVIFAISEQDLIELVG